MILFVFALFSFASGEEHLGWFWVSLVIVLGGFTAYDYLEY